MARGKADRQLTVGKKLEIIAEADRTGMIAATAQKYGVKTGQIRDWKKNEARLRATDPNRLVAASTVQRGHLVFNETYAQYWVGYNKYCSSHTDYDDLKHALHITHKDVMREGINIFSFPTTVDPTATHALECPSCSAFYTADDVKDVYQKDMTSLREELRTFFDNKPFPTKYVYYVTKLDFFKPDPNANDDEDEEEDEEQEHSQEQEQQQQQQQPPAQGRDQAQTQNPTPEQAKPAEASTAAKPAAESGKKEVSIDDYISVYVAICGNGSVMVPMAVFPPVEDWHWERKKPVKLRHAHCLHREKNNDPAEALQFFSVTWKKFYDEEAKYTDKFAFLLDATLEEFHAPEFTEGLKQLEGYGKYWTTLYTMRNPLRHSNFDDALMTFVTEEWRTILTMKKSAQPNDYRKCVAFWFYTAWEFFAGEHARAAFRSCNMFLEDRSAWLYDPTGAIAEAEAEASAAAAAVKAAVAAAAAASATAGALTTASGADSTDDSAEPTETSDTHEV